MVATLRAGEVRRAVLAAGFATDRRAGILGGNEQLATLRQLMPAPSEDGDDWLLDLGCGDGVLLDAALTYSLLMIRIRNKM